MRDRSAETGSVIAEGRLELEKMRREKMSSSTRAGYVSAFSLFSDQAPDGAFKKGWEPDNPECEAIAKAMLATRSEGTGGPSKLMQNLQFVLCRCLSFKRELVDVFTAKKANAQALQVKRQDYPFTPEERAIIWSSLWSPETTKEMRGLVLLLANSAQHGIDVATLKVKALKEALEDITFWEREKTDEIFRFLAWDEVKEWFFEMNFHEDDIYVFKFGYSRDERKKANYNRISISEG